MKTIEIKTQAQFEKLPGNFKSYTLIKILGKDIIINIMTIIKNPIYFSKIDFSKEM